MQYIYVCECDDNGCYDDTKASKLKPTTVTKDGRCHGCGHYAYLTKKIQSNRVVVHDVFHTYTNNTQDLEAWMNG